MFSDTVFWSVVATVVIVPTMLVILWGIFIVLFDNPLEGPYYRSVLVAFLALLINVGLLFSMEAIWT